MNVSCEVSNGLGILSSLTLKRLEGKIGTFYPLSITEDLVLKLGRLTVGDVDGLGTS